MGASMDEDRLQHLIDAYGAEPRRWPAADREAGMALVRTSPRASARLALARALDDSLDAWTLSGAAADLGARIAALAPGARSPVYRRPAVWWAGAGLAAACALGVLVGAMASEPLLHPTHRDAAILAGYDDNTTAFGTSLDLGGGS